MISKAQSDGAADAALPGSKEGAWKWELRKKMWDYMEENNIARCVWTLYHIHP
jgi:5-formyltetrahydrofolate cyclo-ligase